MSNIEQKADRPLSPHLQIYKPIFTMVMSIVHRLTGVGLYFGAFLLAWWLVAASSGAEYFNMVNGFFASIVGRILLFGFTWALLHHMMGGIRHFIWDTGRGFEKGPRKMLARLSLVMSILLTFIVFAIGYWVKGA